LTFTFHPFAGPALRGQCLPFFGMWGHIADVINRVKF